MVDHGRLLMNTLIESLGGLVEAKKYLSWMEKRGLLRGSYRCQYGLASFYDHTLRKAIETCEKECNCGE